MKPAIFRAALPAFLFVVFFMGSAFAPCDCAEGDTKVFIDGKEIVPEGLIQLEKDDTILLEATGLKPHSEVYIKVKKAGIKWAEDTYRVGETGTVKEILDVPEKDLIVHCTVSYYNAENRFVTTEFKLKIR